MTDTRAPADVRFAEPGARWRTVTYGPLICLIVLILELVLGHGPVHWFGLAFCAILLAGFVSLQVVAGKRHVSVELTDTSLREGTETVELAKIATIFPEHDEESWDDEDWQSARALGELAGVPRRRKGIGLKLRDGGLVQAWARDHRGLRAELTAAVEGRPGDDAPEQDSGSDSCAHDDSDADIVNAAERSAHKTPDHEGPAPRNAAPEGSASESGAVRDDAGVAGTARNDAGSEDAGLDSVGVEDAARDIAGPEGAALDSVGSESAALEGSALGSIASGGAAFEGVAFEGDGHEGVRDGKEEAR